MITRFRVEGVSLDKEDLIELLTWRAQQVIRVIMADPHPLSTLQPDGEWECTDDVISGSPGNYKGRMVFAFRKGGMNGTGN
jgi:hypothetical protein